MQKPKDTSPRPDTKDTNDERHEQHHQAQHSECHLLVQRNAMLSADHIFIHRCGECISHDRWPRVE
jgi:hypothetical protein